MRKAILACVALGCGAGHEGIDGAIGSSGDAAAIDAIPDATLDAMPACAAPGQLDPSFGVDGIAAPLFGDQVGGIEDLTSDAQGRIVAVGSALFDQLLEAFVVRYLPDGTLDATFGQGGIVRLSIAARNVTFEGVALQSDGAIIAGGGSETNLGNDEWQTQALVARYTSDGALDPTFGVAGVALATTRYEASAVHVALDPSGRIVASITTDDGRDPGDLSYIAAARFTSDGAIDGSFGDAGFAPPQAPGFSLAGGIAVDSTGRVLVSGSKAPIGGSPSELVGVRYADDGTLDTSFAPSTSFGRSLYNWNAVLDGDALVVVGYDDGGAIAKFTADGALDSTFAGGGQEVTTIAGFFDIARAPNGFLVVGTDGGGQAQQAVVARFDLDGAIDSTFGNGGSVHTAVNASSTAAASVALQSDGRIVVGGSTIGSGETGVFLARYCP